MRDSLQRLAGANGPGAKAPLCAVLGVLMISAVGCRTFQPPPWGSGPPPTDICLLPEPQLVESLGLSFLSYLGYDLVGSQASIDEQIGQCLEEALPLPDGEALWGSGWRLAWGPRVGRLPDADETDNLLYAIERSAGGAPELAVVIRGTNPVAVLDWLEEDFEIAEAVRWNEASGSRSCPRGAKISEGAHKGLRVLRKLRVGDQDIASFVGDWCGRNETPDATVVVTGHSLGGALTPVLALYLAEQEWQAGGRCRDAALEAISFAGPTPGNVEFARCVDERLGELGSGLQRIHNPLDVAPYAWRRKDLKIIPYLYAPAIEADDGDWLLIDWAYDRASFHRYAHSSPEEPPLCASTLYCAGDDTPCLDPTRSHDLLEEGAWQHHYGYLYGLGVIGFDEPGEPQQPALCDSLPTGWSPSWCAGELVDLFCLDPPSS